MAIVWLISTIFSAEAQQPQIDLQSEYERYLTERYAKKPVIVMNYSKDIKAF
jgi:asparaginyl-tRNA synthetase